MSKQTLKPTCPLKPGNLCDERCALCLVHEDDGKDTICAITVLALSVQEIAGGFADE